MVYHDGKKTGLDLLIESGGGEQEAQITVNHKSHYKTARVLCPVLFRWEYQFPVTEIAGVKPAEGPFWSTQVKWQKCSSSLALLQVAGGLRFRQYQRAWGRISPQALAQAPLDVTVLKEQAVIPNAGILWAPGWSQRKMFFASRTDLPLSFFPNDFRDQVCGFSSLGLIPRFSMML